MGNLLDVVPSIISGPHPAHIYQTARAQYASVTNCIQLTRSRYRIGGLAGGGQRFQRRLGRIQIRGVARQSSAQRDRRTAGERRSRRAGNRNGNRGPALRLYDCDSRRNWSKRIKSKAERLDICVRPQVHRERRLRRTTEVLQAPVSDVHPNFARLNVENESIALRQLLDEGQVGSLLRGKALILLRRIFGRSYKGSEIAISVFAEN